MKKSLITFVWIICINFLIAIYFCSKRAYYQFDTIEYLILIVIAVILSVLATHCALENSKIVYKIKENQTENNPKKIEKDIYMINDVADICGVHQQTLRNWEKHKLVKPSRLGNVRVYSGENVALCKKIKEYAGKGIPLGGIQRFLNVD